MTRIAKMLSVKRLTRAPQRRCLAINRHRPGSMSNYVVQAGIKKQKRAAASGSTTCWQKNKAGQSKIKKLAAASSAKTRGLAVEAKAAGGD